MDACVLGLDLGGTKLAMAAFDRRGKMLSRKEVRSPSHDEELMIEALLDLVGGGIESCSAEGVEVKAVGVGAAGYILYPEGILTDAPNIAWSDVPLRRIVGDRTGLPAFLDNDANAAAMGERYAGVCRAVDDFVYLTLGTGIGGGICIDGKIYHGHRGTAAEIGHMVIDPSGPECGCGRRGCLEAFASGSGLEREARAIIGNDRGSLLYRMCDGDLDRITGEMVSKAAQEGDEAAMRAFKKAAHYLGVGLVNLIHLLDPEVVVLGGGVSHSGHLLLDEVRRVISERGIPGCVEGTRIVLSTLGRDAGLFGAAAMAWEGIGIPP